MERELQGEGVGVKPYYERDGITIYHGDCREILPSLKADVVVTDPPYGSITHDGALGDGGRSRLVDFESITAGYLRAVMEFAQPRRWWVSFMEWQHLAELESSPPFGLEFVRFGVWVKPNGSPQFTGDRPGTGWEAIGIFHPPGKKKWNGGGRHAVWNRPVEQGQHPTTKPEPLVRELIRLFSDEGDLVLDPFMGSGTTLVAAKLEGRKAIGIEIEERYCEIAAKRLAQGVLPFAEIRP